MIDLTPIILCVIAVIGIVISVRVIPILKNKYSKQELEKMLQLVRIAVYAAQQLLRDKTGEERKQYVLDFLAKHGYDVDDEAVLNAIEAEVLALHEALVGDDE